MNTEIHELTVAVLDTVSGGSDYKFCWNGPAGTGMYPSYVSCGEGSSFEWGTDEKAIAAQIKAGKKPA